MMTADEIPSGARVLVDSNVLLRVQYSDPHNLAKRAFANLQTRRAELLMTIQNVSEFWNASTRPKINNGFGLSIRDADEQLREFERGMQLLFETRDVYERWLHLLRTYQVVGRQVHDARLAASMLTHNIPYILTFNSRDFER